MVAILLLLDLLQGQQLLFPSENQLVMNRGEVEYLPPSVFGNVKHKGESSENFDVRD